MKPIEIKVLKVIFIIILLSRVCYSQTNTLTLTFTAAENTWLKKTQTLIDNIFTETALEYLREIEKTHIAIHCIADCIICPFSKPGKQLVLWGKRRNKFFRWSTVCINVRSNQYAGRMLGNILFRWGTVVLFRWFYGMGQYT